MYKYEALLPKTSTHSVSKNMYANILIRCPEPTQQSLSTCMQVETILTKISTQSVSKSKYECKLTTSLAYKVYT